MTLLGYFLAQGARLVHGFTERITHTFRHSATVWWRNADAVVTLKFCQRTCQAYHVVKREESNRWQHQSFPFQKVDVCGCCRGNRFAIIAAFFIIFLSTSNRLFHQFSFTTFLSFLERCMICMKRTSACYFGYSTEYRVRIEIALLSFQIIALSSRNNMSLFDSLNATKLTTITWHNITPILEIVHLLLRLMRRHAITFPWQMFLAKGKHIKCFTTPCSATL
jgi:hypothetical protein